MKAEEKKLLMQNLHHYLWNKPRYKWTDDDLYNLRHGVNKGPHKQGGNEVPVLVTCLITGTQQTFLSAAKGAAALGVKKNAVYHVLNGRQKSAGGYLWEKIKK